MEALGAATVMTSLSISELNRLNRSHASIFADVGKGGLKHIQSFVHLCIGDDHWHQKANDVSIRTGGDGDQPVLVAELRDLLGLSVGGLAAVAGTNQLQSLHGAETAHFAD